MRITREIKPPSPWIILFVGYVCLALNGLMVWENANRDSIPYVAVSSFGVFMSLVIIHFSSKSIAYKEIMKRPERNPNLDRIETNPDDMISMNRQELIRLLDTRHMEALYSMMSPDTKWSRFKRFIKDPLRRNEEI